MNHFDTAFFLFENIGLLQDVHHNNFSPVHRVHEIPVNLFYSKYVYPYSPER